MGCTLMVLISAHSVRWAETGLWQSWVCKDKHFLLRITLLCQ